MKTTIRTFIKRKVFRGPDQAVWVKKEKTFRAAVMSELLSSGLLGDDKAVTEWYKKNVYPQYPATDAKLSSGLE